LNSLTKLLSLQQPNKEPPRFYNNKQELELEATTATTRTSQAPTTTTSCTAELSSKERTPKAKAFSTKRELFQETTKRYTPRNHFF
jgi:hypothetical protein